MKINVKNLHVEISKKTILHIDNLKFEGNKLYSIIGMNGSGKTTLLKVILNIFPNIFVKGEVEINDLNTKNFNAKEVCKLVSYVPQKQIIDYDFTVSDIIKIGGYRHQIFRQKFFDKVINDLNLENLIDQSVRTISGGEFQRVQIARAVFQDTPIIILDEPTSSLDVSKKLEIFKYMRYLSKKYNKMIIVVTHNINYASIFSDEIIILKNGKLKSVGKSKNVMTKENIKDNFEFEVEITVQDGVIKTLEHIEEL